MLRLRQVLLDVLPQEELQASRGLVIRVESIDPKWHTQEANLPLFTTANLQIVVAFHPQGLRYFRQVQNLKVLLCPSINSMVSHPGMEHVMLTLHSSQ